MLFSLAPSAILLVMGVVVLLTNLDPKERITKIQGNRCIAFAWLVLVAIFIGGGVIRTLIHGSETGRYWISGSSVSLLTLLVVLLTTKLRTWDVSEPKPEPGLERIRSDRPYLDSTMYRPHL